MEIKHVCSLGTHCHTSQLLKTNHFKRCSYPFDWIFINYNDIIHCLEDDFKIFLDKTYYTHISDTKCGHSYYHKHLFNHRNPLNDTDYNYYIRCVDRFKKMLQYEEHKLFIMILIDREFNDHLQQELIKFNNTFSKYTKNYTLLVIVQISKKQRYHNILKHDNIDFIELHTKSCSNGIFFCDKDDNDYLNTIINQYNFA